jgi:hypothetical protein
VQQLLPPNDGRLSFGRLSFGNFSPEKRPPLLQHFGAELQHVGAGAHFGAGAALQQVVVCWQHEPLEFPKNRKPA